jgi:hypothetical protein
MNNGLLRIIRLDGRGLQARGTANICGFLP